MMAELLSLPSSCGVDVIADAQTMVNDGSLLRSPSIELRGLGHKLNHFLQMKCSGSTIDSSAFTAGGRHNNDFPDFRKIAILPTSDEFSCTERPFFRRAEDIGELQGHQRVTTFLDTQFRLLREDMLSELRVDVQFANGRKKGRKLTFRIRYLSVARLSYGRVNDIRLHTCCLGVSCKSGLENISQLSKEKRISYVKENRNFMKHQAFGCLTWGAEIVAFATIERDKDAVVADLPIVMLRIAGDDAFKKALLYLKLYSDVHFVREGIRRYSSGCGQCNQRAWQWRYPERYGNFKAGETRSLTARVTACGVDSESQPYTRSSRYATSACLPSFRVSTDTTGITVPANASSSIAVSSATGPVSAVPAESPATGAAAGSAASITTMVVPAPAPTTNADGTPAVAAPAPAPAPPPQPIIGLDRNPIPQKRHRGRPHKSEQGNVPPKPRPPVKPSFKPGTGRPRGRPRKGDVEAAAAAAVASGQRQGDQGQAGAQSQALQQPQHSQVHPQSSTQSQAQNQPQPKSQPAQPP
ncbi:hypothetical protein AAWM_08703 [Aspergillus awamori]|uniref:Uncharacterized protein n=1 Tax=Aspergillus awamori TaxID=105351 RepID=A0A401L2R6_ASPAW|nr:hypothetical protein AAWM_08703 [Aspergillus awamori]